MRALASVALTLALALAGTTACNDVAPPPDEGLQLTRADDDYVSGTYAAGDHAIAFEAAYDSGLKSVRVTDLAGAELIRFELADTRASLRMWHYGVAQEIAEDPAISPETEAWLASDEVQLVASMWREIFDTPIAELTAAEALVQYGIHVDEVLGKMIDEANGAGALHETEEKHRCTDCPGKCGPGCWSWGSNWYCENHDCCCDHYGSWACYSWCLAYPKCGHRPSC